MSADSFLTPATGDVPQSPFSNPEAQDSAVALRAEVGTTMKCVVCGRNDSATVGPPVCTACVREHLATNATAAADDGTPAVDGASRIVELLRSGDEGEPSTAPLSESPSPTTSSTPAVAVEQAPPSRLKLRERTDVYRLDEPAMDFFDYLRRKRLLQEMRGMAWPLYLYAQELAAPGTMFELNLTKASRELHLSRGSLDKARIVLVNAIGVLRDGGPSPNNRSVNVYSLVIPPRDEKPESGVPEQTSQTAPNNTLFLQDQGAPNRGAPIMRAQDHARARFSARAFVRASDRERADNLAGDFEPETARASDRARPQDEARTIGAPRASSNSVVVVVPNSKTTTTAPDAPALRAAPPDAAAATDPNIEAVALLIDPCGFTPADGRKLAIETGCTPADVGEAIEGMQRYGASLARRGQVIESPQGFIRKWLCERWQRGPSIEQIRREAIGDGRALDEATEREKAKAAAVTHNRNRQVLEELHTGLKREAYWQACDECENEVLASAWRCTREPLRAANLCAAMLDVVRRRVAAWVQGMSPQDQADARAAYIGSFVDARHRATLEAQICLPIDPATKAALGMFDYLHRNSLIEQPTADAPTE